LYFWPYMRTMNANQENPTLRRLEEQIDWYDKKSAFNQSWFKRLKIIELIAAALIPILAGLSALFPHPILITIITGSLGALIVVLESLQGLYQFQSNWISYRSTCEGLRHEKYLWLARAGHYAGAKDPDRLLAERIESLISTEHAKWVSAQEKVAQKEVPIVEK
jgi:hypothetical protein